MFVQFSQTRFSRDVQLLTLATGILAVSFLGVQTLAKTLYILRLGYGLEYLGLFSAVGAIAYMVMGLPSGALGNHIGTRWSMVCGGIITVVGMAVIPLVEFLPPAWHYTWPLLTQVLTSVGWSLFSINLVPALMSGTTVDNRSSAYAINSMIRGFGAFIGALLAGILPNLGYTFFGYAPDQPDSYRLSLWLSALLGLFALMPLFAVRTTTQASPTDLTQTTTTFPTWIFFWLVLHVYLAQMGIAVCQTFCSAYMDTDLRLSTAVIGLIAGASQFAGVLSPLVAPRLAARYGQTWLMTITTLAAAFSLLPLALLPHWLGATIGSLGVTALAAVWMPASQVFQMELVDARWRGLAYGIVSMAMGLTYTSASLAGGQIAAQWGYSYLFLLAGGLSLLGALISWAIQRNSSVAAKPSCM